MTDPLDWLARRAEAGPLFLAPVLAAFARSERLDDRGLAAALGCEVAALARLRLCRAPRADHFWDDAAKIAAAFGLSPERLAEVVRRGEVLRALQGPAVAGPTLLAARDKLDEPGAAEGPSS